MNDLITHESDVIARAIELESSLVPDQARVVRELAHLLLEVSGRLRASREMLQMAQQALRRECA